MGATTEGELDFNAGCTGAEVVVVALDEACRENVTPGLLGMKSKPLVILTFLTSLSVIWLIEQCQSA